MIIIQGVNIYTEKLEGYSLSWSFTVCCLATVMTFISASLLFVEVFLRNEEAAYQKLGTSGSSLYGKRTRSVNPGSPSRSDHSAGAADGSASTCGRDVPEGSAEDHGPGSNMTIRQVRSASSDQEDGEYETIREVKEASEDHGSGSNMTIRQVRSASSDQGDGEYETIREVKEASEDHGSGSYTTIRQVRSASSDQKDGEYETIREVNQDVPYRQSKDPKRHPSIASKNAGTTEVNNARLWLADEWLTRSRPDKGPEHHEKENREEQPNTTDQKARLVEKIPAGATNGDQFATRGNSKRKKKFRQVKQEPPVTGTANSLRVDEAGISVPNNQMWLANSYVNGMQRDKDKEE